MSAAWWLDVGGQLRRNAEGFHDAVTQLQDLMWLGEPMVIWRQYYDGAPVAVLYCRAMNWGYES